MSLEVCFDEAKARRIRECLLDSRPIEGITTVDDLLTLAGACFHTLVFLKPTFPSNWDWSQTTPETQEATFDCMLKVLRATIEHCGHLFMHIDHDGNLGTTGPLYRFRASLDGEKVTFTPTEEKPDRSTFF